MGLITDYFELQVKYEAQYGERTVLLMQVGTFYETWEFDPTFCESKEHRKDKNGKIWNDTVGHSINLSSILNCVLAYEDSTAPYSPDYPHKVGFPCIAFEKYKATLLANDYLIIRIDQVKTLKGKSEKTERFVAEICSPTMQFESITTSRPTSNIACLYIEYQQGTKGRYENFLVTTGASVIDIITGQNRVCEFHSKVEDQINAIQELYRFMIAHYPREIIIHINDMPAGLNDSSETNPYIKYLEKVLELKRFDRLFTFVNEVPDDYRKINYQIDLLNKIFDSEPISGANVIQKRNDKIIQEIGLDSVNYGRIAYMILLQHCYSYNKEIIVKLSKPDIRWLDENRHLILAHNAIIQLDLIPNQNINSKVLFSRKKAEINSLMSVLDENRTHLGRRALHTLLQNPMSNPNDIDLYYNMVTEMFTPVNDNEPLWSLLDRQLRELPDIARLQRKLEIKLINPRELTVLFRAYTKIVNIYIFVMNLQVPTLHTQMLNKEDVINFNDFLLRFSNIINFEALERCSFDTSPTSNVKWLEFSDCPIKQGIYPDLDEQSSNLITAELSLQSIVDHLNGFIEQTRGKKLEFKSPKKKTTKKQIVTNTVLVTTTSKANTLINARVNIELCGRLKSVSHSSSEQSIVSDKITNLCHTIDNTKIWMREKLLLIYNLILDEMVNKYNFYVPIMNFIAKLDLIHSYAKVSSQYQYHRPELVTEGDISFLEAKDIRHPIIERIIDGSYITNDIFLGNGNDIRSNGMCLYGVNTSGKSALGKAIAENIIMAQIGCFVPSHLKYKPYSKIITRLTSNDNLFKGESSFSIEISELRTILRQANSTTLVIGDEICAGTETNSGTAITVGMIATLIDKESTFIFATHMHELIDLSYIKNLPREKLNISHLAIEFDTSLKTLIYDRKIKPGSGNSVYGIMIAEALNLPQEFLDKTYQVLKEILGENKDIMSMKKSRYNSKLYVDRCAVCQGNEELQTHHIIEQKNADENGLVNGQMHKNSKDNLIVLCRKCHTNLHGNKQELETISTTNGTLIGFK